VTVPSPADFEHRVAGASSAASSRIRRILASVRKFWPPRVGRMPSGQDGSDLGWLVRLRASPPLARHGFGRRARRLASRTASIMLRGSAIPSGDVERRAVVGRFERSGGQREVDARLNATVLSVPAPDRDTSPRRPRTLPAAPVERSVCRTGPTASTPSGAGAARQAHPRAFLRPSAPPSPACGLRPHTASVGRESHPAKAWPPAPRRRHPLDGQSRATRAREYAVASTTRSRPPISIMRPAGTREPGQNLGVPRTQARPSRSPPCSPAR